MGQAVHGMSCPWAGLSMGRLVQGASCSWGRAVHGGELYMGRAVHGMRCHGASSLGASFDGVSCPGIQIQPTSKVMRWFPFISILEPPFLPRVLSTSYAAEIGDQFHATNQRGASSYQSDNRGAIPSYQPRTASSLQPASGVAVPT